jgi:hypothetical protein
MKKEIFKIAKSVRRWVERHPRSTESLIGWCGICSFRIFDRLKKINLRPIFVSVSHPWLECDCHCFVLCEDYLVDVTATQFGFNKNIVILNIDDAKYMNWYWNLENIFFKSYSKSRIKRFFEEWPDDQNPFLIK